jgi:uncharacterized protein with PIN domain
MVLDTSALLAILLAEPESQAMVRAVGEDERRLVAMAEREPLLFKGDDFAHTDVAVVAY